MIRQLQAAQQPGVHAAAPAPAATPPPTLSRATPYAIGGIAAYWTIDRLVTTFTL